MTRPFALIAATALVLAGVCDTAGAESAGAKARQRVERTTRIVPGSSSVILQARHIVVLTVMKVDMTSDKIHLDVALADTLKGVPIAAQGVRLRVSGPRARPGRREIIQQGPWPPAEQLSGARLVVFSSSSSSAAIAVLGEAAILRVLSAVPAEEEVRRALALERAGGPLSARITSVAEPPPLSALFGEYVFARLEEDTLYRDAAGFDKVMSWLEDPGRSTSLQTFEFQALVGKVLLTEPNPPGFTERLALAALRILGSTSDEPLAGQIVDTYLPNLLGLEGSAPPKTMDAVLAGDEGTWTRARLALQRRAAGGARDRLLDWIGR